MAKQKNAGQGGGASGPFDGGFLDSLRNEGEQAVDSQIAGLHSTMERVQAFSENVQDSDLDALRSEWQQISEDLKNALQSGLSALEDGRKPRQQAVVADEIQALEREVARRNETIAQLSETVKDLNKELEEKDRRQREEIRGLRDQVGEQGEELDGLRARHGEAEERLVKLKVDHDAAVAERDELHRSSARDAETHESERTLQEERLSGVVAELEEARAAVARLENEKRDSTRHAGDQEKRVQALEKVKTKAESERDRLAQEAGRQGKEIEGLSARVVALEKDLGTHRERSQKEQKRLRKAETRSRADADMARARVQDALRALDSASTALRAVSLEPPPAEAPDEDGGAAPPA